MPAGQGFEAGLLPEDLVAPGLGEAALVGPAGVGLGAEHHDVDQIVEPVDGMGHEQGVDGVERAGGCGRDTGVDEVPVRSVAGQLTGEGDPALLGAERFGVRDRGSVQLLPAGLGPQCVRHGLAQEVGRLFGEHLVVLGQFGGHLHPLGAQAALAVRGGDDRVLAVLVVQGAAPPDAPVRQLGGRRPVEAELRLGRGSEPGHGDPFGGGICGLQSEVFASQVREACELRVDRSVPVVEDVVWQIVGQSGGGEGRGHADTSRRGHKGPASDVGHEKGRH